MKMKSFNFKITVIPIFMFAFACTNGVKPGSVVMKVSDDQAYVSLGGREVVVGDRVEIYRNFCRTPVAPPRDLANGSKCKGEIYGEGEVVRIINEKYSEIRFEKGVLFKEGDKLKRKVISDTRR